MATDRIRTYLDALKELEKATRATERVVNVVHDASKKLKSWRSVGVSGVKTHHIPPDVQLGSQVISANDWPTLQQLGEALSGWHEAYARARDAYMAVPKPDRKNLKPLPKYD